MKQKSRHAAMEMSMGTIVTIVLVVAVLVMGLFFIQKLTTVGGGAISSISTGLTQQINKAFTDGSASKISVSPSGRILTVKRGSNPPEGFGFSIYNQDKTSAQFNYSTVATDVSNCQGTVSKQTADSYIIGGQGAFALAGTQALDPARLVSFSVPSTATSCTVVYTISVYENNVPYTSADIQVTFK